MAISACFLGLGEDRVLDLDAFLRDFDTHQLPLSKAWRSILGKRCCMLPLFLNFPLAVRDRILGKMDISSDLVRLSYAICAYVSNLSSV